MISLGGFAGGWPEFSEATRPPFKHRYYFDEGKCYLDELDVLRCKIVGYWYCARFESVLDTIKRDDFILRHNYEEKRNLSTMLKIVWIGFYVTFRHIITQMLCYLKIGE